MKVSANRFCNLLMEIAASHGVRSVICSPGSRNAPLLIAAAGCQELQTRVVVDERVAAFIALGEATVSRSPVMLVCTSGTALLNYAPAVAEAFYSGIPLIVVSADRPMEWIDQDDSQTIRQAGALDNFIKKSYDLPVFSPDDGKRGATLEWFAVRTVNDALLTSLHPKQGPVHINVQLDVPLGALANPREDNPRIIRTLAPIGEYDRETILGLARQAYGKRIMLLAGFMRPDHKLSRAVAMIASLPEVCVMAESVSNLDPSITRLDNSGDWTMVDSVLWSLDKNLKEQLRPDIVISIGGALISRELKEYLRSYPPAEHWAVGWQDSVVDPLKSLTLRIEASPARFIRQFAGALRYVASSARSCPEERYAEEWRKKRIQVAEALDGFADKAPWSDLKVFHILSQQDWRKSNLFLSNGTTVRYAQLFPMRAHASFCNRGVSGIDGSTSTALGGALSLQASDLSQSRNVSELQTVVITGDMSFCYDIGALACGLIPERMKIIVINNGGGGIFRYIGSTSALPEKTLDRFFCADPGMDIQHVAEAFHLKVFCAESEERLINILPMFLQEEEASLLEIRTDGVLSGNIMKELKNTLSSC
ncbi:MAG: 2-succinyl-5-enolpyruvyl-6-hydroxy-3-cyclohexene-1-carboxylic-acid synthase [Bacteroides sp.]|nr:2-succinyl-5-enolpyruvyl-6-hydroxy-3-cyclohexene-1-carboxylic-acid synthase [Bacteroides sp.]